ncbi:MAG: hypothetical protein GY953_19400, partial [bacterium]|nr:hypothetical protein [bacterium]
GQLVAYASDRSGEGHLDIWLQQTSGGEAIQLTQHPADDFQPAFSPDGARIAFRSEREGGGIYSISTLGGEARLIAEHGLNPRFSPDGAEIVYWIDRAVGVEPISVVPASGGAPRGLDFGITGVDPLWVPDGKHLLFSCFNTWGLESFGWCAATTSGGTPEKTGAYDHFRRMG